VPSLGCCSTALFFFVPMKRNCRPAYRFYAFSPFLSCLLSPALHCRHLWPNEVRSDASVLFCGRLFHSFLLRPRSHCYDNVKQRKLAFFPGRQNSTMRTKCYVRPIATISFLVCSEPWFFSPPHKRNGSILVALSNSIALDILSVRSSTLVLAFGTPFCPSPSHSLIPPLPSYIQYRYQFLLRRVEDLVYIFDSIAVPLKCSHYRHTGRPTHPLLSVAPGLLFFVFTLPRIFLDPVDASPFLAFSFSTFQRRGES